MWALLTGVQHFVANEKACGIVVLLKGIHDSLVTILLF